MNILRFPGSCAVQVKTLAGQENVVSELVRIVRVSEADKTVLKAALGALAVLSSDDRNLKKMTAEGSATAGSEERQFLLATALPCHVIQPNLDTAV